MSWIFKIETQEWREGLDSFFRKGPSNYVNALEHVSQSGWSGLFGALSLLAWIGTWWAVTLGVIFGLIWLWLCWSPPVEEFTEHPGHIISAFKGFWRGKYDEEGESDFVADLFWKVYDGLRGFIGPALVHTVFCIFK